MLREGTAPDRNDLCMDLEEAETVSESVFWTAALRKACGISVQCAAMVGVGRLIGPDIAWWQAFLIGVVVSIVYGAAHGASIFTSGATEAAAELRRGQ